MRQTTGQRSTGAGGPAVTEPDPAEYSVSELEEELESVGTVEALESLLAAEQAGPDRKTAKEAIEARIEAVAGGESVGDAGGPLADFDLDLDLEDLRETAGTTAAALVARSAALDRLFGDELSEPVAGTAGFGATFGVLVVAALWPAVTAVGGPTVWTAVVSVGAVFGAALVVLVALSLADVEQRWLPAALVAAAYLIVGAGLLVVSLLLRGVLGSGQPIGRGLVAPMVAVLGVQAGALALVLGAFSRPVLPAAELDGAAPRAASLHVANWWRVAGVGVVLEVVLLVGLPGWVGGSGYSLAGPGLAGLFLPTAAAVAALLVYVLRKAAVIERAVAAG